MGWPQATIIVMLALAPFFLVVHLLVFLVLLLPVVLTFALAAKLSTTLALELSFGLNQMSIFIVFSMVCAVLSIGLKAKFEPFRFELTLVNFLFAVALSWTFLVRFLLVMLFLIHLVL